MKKYWRFLSLATILVVVLATIIGTSAASAQTVCSPATEISVPFVKDGGGTFCWHTTELCYQINSWQLNTLDINGTSYKNMFVVASSIPPLNGGYTITYDGTTFGHFDTNGPFQGSTPGNGPCHSVPPTFTPAGPTAIFTRTPTLATRTPTFHPPTRTLTPTTGPSATRTRTPTSGPSATRTNTPCGYPSTCVTPNTPTNTPATVVPTWTPSNTPATPAPTLPGGICSPATTITAPFLFSRFNTPPDNTVGTHCWRINSVGFINSFNNTHVSVNGLNVTNMWVHVSSFPAQIDGWWYISHTSQAIWGHFEAQP